MRRYGHRSPGYDGPPAACPGKLDSALPHDHPRGPQYAGPAVAVEGATMLFRRSLLDQVERGALNPRHDLSDLLRKVIALGGQAGSADLRDWARLELDGYAAEAPEAVPAYRVVQAPINANGSDGFRSFTSMMIGPFDLPDFTQEYFRGGLRLTMGVAELELLVAKGESATLQTAPMQDLASIMNRTGNYSVTLERVYYSLSPVTVAGVLSSIRTNLVALVSEIRGTGGVSARGDADCGRREPRGPSCPEGAGAGHDQHGHRRRCLGDEHLGGAGSGRLVRGPGLDS